MAFTSWFSLLKVENIDVSKVQSRDNFKIPTLKNWTNGNLKYIEFEQFDLIEDINKGDSISRWFVIVVLIYIRAYLFCIMKSAAQPYPRDTKPLGNLNVSGFCTLGLWSSGFPMALQVCNNRYKVIREKGYCWLDRTYHFHNC